ncbi:hypothetical protein HN018_08990 [Lichenicola cladoniae]|uniref:Methyltransferase FkbM domain-containing protein n=1 Tax=Lichenicola cladoniae TaxID=1484109 RepID=A0A6M8HNZ6_9PROT|nr:FkbM family methyltransferase [Lichenicola cladoniae]NPD68336.1 hypothetical protein [Acetobacteraceae bacterium]QKE90163.1 hypothetical protein HN018_08990 [Lichenicola cladoniae]
MKDIAISNGLESLPLLDTVLWSYRLLLGRNPEDLEELSRHFTSQVSFSEIRQRFLQSQEFENKVVRRRRSKIDQALLDDFPPYNGPGLDGSFYDFIGTRTRCSYLPAVYAGASGLVEGPPGTERFGLHEPAEWEGTLRSVLEAGSRFVAVELGAGWGPWLVAGARAAQRRGIQDIRLAGVEGASSHYDFMLQHFRDNGLDPASHLLFNAVAGVHDGIARFPKLVHPSSNWGAEANFEQGQSLEQFEEVESISIATLLAKLPKVDLLHCDIQGAEADVLLASGDLLSQQVSRIVVGTHGRVIEGRLMEFFGANNWTLEHDSACRFNQDATGKLQLAADGVQVWRNNRSQQDMMM